MHVLNKIIVLHKLQIHQARYKQLFIEHIKKLDIYSLLLIYLYSLPFTIPKQLV